MSEVNSTTTENTEQFHEATPSDYETLYQESQEEISRLKAVITSARLAPVTDHPQKDAKPAVTAARLRATIGDVALRNMTREDKLRALSLDPSTIDDALLQKCFGLASKGNDGKSAREIYNKSPLRYRQLKQAAEILGYLGA